MQTTQRYIEGKDLEGRGAFKTSPQRRIGLSSTLSWNPYIDKISLKISKTIGIAANDYSHTEPLCKKLRVLKSFDIFYVAVWKSYYTLMYNDLPSYFLPFTMQL